MTHLSGPMILPQSGTVKRLVLIFHGYGADGDNLIDLGGAWAEILPDTAFVAPNAPTPCELGGLGYQWLSIDHEKTGEAKVDHVREGLREVLDSVSAYIKGQAEHYNVSLNNVALVGFSQGGMLSIHQGIYGLEECAGVISYSGGFSTDKTLTQKNAPPVFLCHGDRDDVVPMEFSIKGCEDLVNLGSDAAVTISPNAAHEITQEGFQKGGLFLRDLFFSNGSKKSTL